MLRNILNVDVALLILDIGHDMPIAGHHSSAEEEDGHSKAWPLNLLKRTLFEVSILRLV